MFECLEEIGLFDYLADTHEYWQQAQKMNNGKREFWYRLFKDEDASLKCGIQLTQAYNCAILRDSDSTQPSEAALNEISRGEPRCLFNRFQISPALKLIIFLGTTRNLEKYWEKSCYYKSNIKVLSIPHPSGKSRVYNNDDLYKPLSENDNTQLRNAKNRITKAKTTINELLNNK